MPSFNPFSSVTGRNSYSLFDIRLNDDFIVFRGSEQESAGQLLKGVVVLCLSSPLRIEDVHLRLIGTLRLRWGDGSSGTSSVTGSHRFDKTSTILDHRWEPFVGSTGKSMILPAGNHEYPFEYTLPGNTTESIEGIPEASITYRLKATVRRGKLNPDLHAYKHLRVIRTLEPSALEFLHAMSVENIWPNKVEYSITIPQKAVIFGGTVALDMRFTPLLKGLKLNYISVKLGEVRECTVIGATGLSVREHRKERDVSSWRWEINPEEHWHDAIEDTGQEGWVMNQILTLPKRLKQCIQDLDTHGIKVRHKLKIIVSLRNPDGHFSELRATLPLSIFISPNIPFDENGTLVNQTPNAASNSQQSFGSFAPPGYGEHVLDQLYEEIDVGGYQTPAIQSGMASPVYGQSRAGSSDNLAALANSVPIAPAALVSRLTDVSLNQSSRNSSYISINPGSGGVSPVAMGQSGANRQENLTGLLSRTSSEEEGSSEPTLVDAAELAELSRVPSYATAVRTPARSRNQSEGGFVPDYQTALSAPRTPPAVEASVVHMSPILEFSSAQPPASRTEPPLPVRSARDNVTT